MFNTGKKGSKQLFYTVLLDTTLLCINHSVPDILTPQGSGGFQYQCKKNAKGEYLLISSIIYTAVNFKVLCCFLICYRVFWQLAMKSDSNSDFFPMFGAVFVFFALINKKNINCVMTI